MRTYLALIALLSLSSVAQAQQWKSQRVGPPSSDRCQELPALTWGSAVVWLYANGGVKTQPGSIVDQQGLCLNIKLADNPDEQAKRFKNGDTPFFRGTARMAASFATDASKDPRTTLTMLHQETYSQGDHCVARGQIKNLNDLKTLGRKPVIALQFNKGLPGPHIGLVDDFLRTAGMTVDDVTLRRLPDLSGTANSPATVFENDAKVDIACVITPDMLALTGGVNSECDGAECKVEGAHVLVSTQQLSRSIVDGLYARADWVKANRSTAHKVTAAFLIGTEQFLQARKKYRESKGRDPAYKRVLVEAQRFFNQPEAFPNPETVDELVADCNLVGYPGNLAFFNASADDPAGFAGFTKSGADMAKRLGFGSGGGNITPASLNWNDTAFASISQRSGGTQAKFNADAVEEEVEKLDAKGMEERTLFSFTVGFKPDQTVFPEEQYRREFKQVVDLMRKYGGAVIVVEGHVDPTVFLSAAIRAGFANRQIVCSDGKHRPPCAYAHKGRPLSVQNTEYLAALVNQGAFANAQYDPKGVLVSANNTSHQRARAVREGIYAFAAKLKLELDRTQLTATGAGVRAPVVIVRDKSEKHLREKNMRVVVRVVSLPTERISAEQEDDVFGF